MDKRRRAAAIIVYDNKILLMHRRKKGLEYYVIPGGTMESDESPEETVIREIKEETALNIELGDLLFTYEAKFDYGYYFAVQSFAGTTKLGGPELGRNNSDNHYELIWLLLSELKNIKLLPEKVNKKLQKIIL